MQKTVKALADLRAHWREEGCPSVAKIAKKANVPNATANRYLTGVTKGGAPETIRALAIAMDRSDIAQSIPYTDPNNSRTGIYVAELSQQYQEKLQQQLAESDARHKQEMETLVRDHRVERDDWHTLRKALHEENVNLRTSFDKAVSFRDAQLRRQYIEKTILFVLLSVSVVVHVIK
jgi:transcriptional regulator with XRE-family HTH domain